MKTKHKILILSLLLLLGFSYSADAHVLTARGSAQVDTAQAKFGTGSLLLSTSAGDRIDTPDHADFAFGSGNFTIELFLRAASGTNTVGLVGQGAGAGSRAFFFYRSSAGLNFDYSTNGTATTALSVAWDGDINIWYHIALVRNGNDLKFFVDGTQVGATKDLTGVTLYDSTTVFMVGDVPDIGEGPNAWYDEIRISNVARWTANFTAPSAAYCGADANNLLLVHADGDDASTTFTDDETSECVGVGRVRRIIIQ